MTTVTPYLGVHDAQAAIWFYAAAFGAELVERYDDGDRSGWLVDPFGHRWNVRRGSSPGE